jgi:F-type H+-transporting ATPase subunit alpha
LLLTKVYLLDVPVAQIGAFEAALHSYMNSQHKALMDNINATANYDKGIEAELRKGIETFKATQSW